MTKVYIFIALFLLSCSSSSKWEHKEADASSLNPYQRGLKHFQDSMNLSFTTGENQVLLKEDLDAGRSLAFFPINQDYRQRAKFQSLKDGRVFEMKTSTDRLPKYRDFGIVSFELFGDSLSLHLYQNLEYPEYLFCPFKDLSNGADSYGSGRYLDFELKDTADFYIDFNKSYNPLCAYNYKYSCPIPPKENHLDIRIEAGVKNWTH